MAYSILLLTTKLCVSLWDKKPIFLFFDSALLPAFLFLSDN